MRRMRLLHLVPIAALALSAVPLGAGEMTRSTQPDAAFDAPAAARFADLALACVHREYPNKIAHVLQGDADVKPPRQLTPAFFGCYDWHSAVHGHWLLARLARSFPEAPFAAPARGGARPQPDGRQHRRRGRLPERRRAGSRSSVPTGSPGCSNSAPSCGSGTTRRRDAGPRALAPLEKAAAGRLREWLPKLSQPIRVGEHDQTAFAFGLVLDWARGPPATATSTRCSRSRIDRLLRQDRTCPLGLRAVGPGLPLALPGRGRPDAPGAGACRLRRLADGLPARGPAATAAAWLEPAVVTDPSDPKLAHLDGLNLSRAWMLEGIASGLPPADPRLPALRHGGSRTARPASPP